LLLALAGGLIVSWVQVRKRLIHFAVLRSLGAAPRHIASILAYEQGIIYLLAVALGILCGGMLSLQLLPAFVFTSATISGAFGDISSNTFYAIQNQPSVRVLIPGSLVFVLAILLAVASIALIIMVRTVSQPSMSQTLRLNED
ncbi:MAG TPA: FtsX-like permease family protein, partial [Ktedonobacteraceae bacterium]|nr:FtsX-like permease family protein [Ktedonobacteraceae bacterium]